MSENVISKDEMSKLLGRSLSTYEDANYSLYLEIATQRLKDLLCITDLPATLEIDLKLLLARCFAVISVEQSASLDNVERKKVEDFEVTYNEASKETPMSRFVQLNILTISKYSECQGKVKSGKIYGNCIPII